MIVATVTTVIECSDAVGFAHYLAVCEAAPLKVSVDSDPVAKRITLVQREEHD